MEMNRKREAMAEERWSSEALQAMETHLWLLQKANQCEQQEERQCLPGQSEKRVPRLSGQIGAEMGPDLNLKLNSQLPLPYGWEQFLDLRTGQVYYIDWKNCRRSYMDPRLLPAEQDDDISEAEVSSECPSNANNHLNASCTKLRDGDTELKTKLITSPMLQEDWHLMEVRGWMSLDSDDRSEVVSSESSSPNYVVGKRLIDKKSFCSWPPRHPPANIASFSLSRGPCCGDGFV